MTRGRRKAKPCLDCGKTKTVAARGLCFSCYRFDRSDGPPSFPLVMEYRVWTRREADRAVELRSMKLTYPEIASRLGRSRYSVKEFFRRLNHNTNGASRGTLLL